VADIVWPAGLPQAPLVRSLSETFPALALRTEMETGPAKMRRRATAVPRSFDIELSLTRNQVALFDQFYTDSIKLGSIPFEWKHPRTGAVCDMRITSTPNARPKAPRQSGTEYWSLSFGIEILPVPAVVIPGVQCVAFFGMAGTPVFGTDSTISVDLASTCRTDTTHYNTTTVTRTFVFDAIVNDETDQPLTITWKFTNGDGTSTITWHRDLGWSCAIIPEHSPAVSCGADTDVRPLEHDEATDFPYTASDAWPQEVLEFKWASPGETVLDVVELLEATVISPSCGELAPQTQGFTVYDVVVGPSGGGGGGEA